MNDDLRNRIQAIFERIEGGSHDDMTSLLDAAIEEGEITEKEFADYETQICFIFDSRWFTCEGCGWTLPIEEMSDEEDAWRCGDCA